MSASLAVLDRVSKVLVNLIAVAAVTLAAAAYADPGVPPAQAADQRWLLGEPPAPADNPMSPERVALGKALFFDTRISANGTVSCANCHNPSFGWSDGLKTGMGINATLLPRHTPTVINTAYNTQFMWDGRKKSLEDQALGPMSTPQEMNTDFGQVIALMNESPEYREMFQRAYPGEAIDKETMAKAIASFERTVISRDSRFDRWVAGDRSAITLREFRGYLVFTDPGKGNCETCHSAPNFTDNGYHNLGVAHPGAPEDLGRFNIRKVAAMKGAFKTPTLRNCERTAPYFHNGSAATLHDVIEHYDRGGDEPGNPLVEIHPLNLSARDKEDLEAFIRALTGSGGPLSVPLLPHNVPIYRATSQATAVSLAQPH